jgi:hypothetical protein
MQGRYTAFLAQQPSRLAPASAIEVAMFRALERAWRNPRHQIHERFRDGPPAASRKPSAISPAQHKDK